MSSKEYYNSKKQELIKDLIELINKHINLEYDVFNQSIILKLYERNSV